MSKKRDSGIEWIGEIPEHWCLERLQWHISEIKESNKPGKSRQVLSLTNKRGVIPYEEKGAQGNVAKEDYSQYKLAYPGTIVANSMNILIGSVGRCDYFGCVSPVYYVYKPNEGESLEFINYMFQMEQFQKELRRYANGILEIRLRVSSDGILKREMAFPPIDEQVRIVSYLNQRCSQVDTLIANVQAQIEKLKAYRQTVITETVTKGIDPTAQMKASGIQWIGDIPAHWGTPKISMLAAVSSGATPDRAHPEYWNGSISWLKTGELQNNEIYESEEYITEAGLKNSSVQLYEPNTILVAMYGQGKTRGMTALLRVQSTTNQACAGIVVTSPLVSYEFLWKVLIGAYNGLRELAVGSGQPNLNQALIRDFRIPLPPIHEQQEICEFLSQTIPQIDRLIAIKEAKIEKLEQYKKSLIYEYVTGKKEVH